MILFLVRPIFFKTVFLQKVILRKEYVNFLKRVLRKRIVYDFDDAIYIKSNGQPQSKKVKLYLDHSLKNANFCLATCDQNVKYAEIYCRKVGKIIGPIDTNRYKPLFTHNYKVTVTIGWIGSPSTTKYLNSVLPVFEKLMDEFNDKVRFRFMGASKEAIKFQKADIVDWSYDTEFAFLRSIDIGVMPLFDDEWSKGKGGYKILQYMAMGIPSVASGIGANNEILTDGKEGFLVKENKEWVEKLALLISDNGLRRSLGENAREKAIQKFSVEANLEAFKQALSD